MKYFILAIFICCNTFAISKDQVVKEYIKYPSNQTESTFVANKKIEIKNDIQTGLRIKQFSMASDGQEYNVNTSNVNRTKRTRYIIQSHKEKGQIITKKTYSTLGKRIRHIIHSEEKVSIEGNTQTVEATIFPNPVSNILKVNLMNNSKKIQLKLMDLLGNVLVSTHSFDSNIEIDMEGYSRGIYVLHITNNSGIIQTRKIIKN